VSATPREWRIPADSAPSARGVAQPHRLASFAKSLPSQFSVYSLPHLASVARGVAHPTSPPISGSPLRFPPRLVCPPSIVFGGGHVASCATRGSMSSRLRAVPSGFTPVSLIPGVSFQSRAEAGGHPVQPLPPVGRADARSAQIGSPAGISQVFQVKANSGEPFTAILARNLLSKDRCRTALGDEAVKSGPKVALVGVPLSLASARKRLTGTGACPDSSGVFESGPSQGERPSADSGEEMALGVTPKIRRLNIDNGSFIHIPWGDMPLLDEFPQPRGGFRVNLVVERLAQCTVSDSIRFFNCSRSAMKFTVICMKIGC